MPLYVRDLGVLSCVIVSFARLPKCANFEIKAIITLINYPMMCRDSEGIPDLPDTVPSTIADFVKLFRRKTVQDAKNLVVEGAIPCCGFG